MTNTQISRDIKEIGDKAEILAIQDGKRVRFQFPDRATAVKAYLKMRRAGADYLDTSEDGRAHRWISAAVIR